MKDLVDIICWFISLAGQIFAALKWEKASSMIDDTIASIKKGFEDKI